MLISIDNHPAARPATNLNAADIIFENPVQGNSTRFVALYGCDGAGDTIGPVRSGRWIQRDLWQQLRALPVIFGAAPYTTAYFAEHGMPYIDGNVEPWGFFSRGAGRPAPYNVYLDMELLQDTLRDHPGLAQRAADAGDPRAILDFDPDWDAPDHARDVQSVQMWTSASWTFGWRFNAGTGLYERIDAGRATTDAADNGPLTRRTVIVQRAVSERPFADPRPEADPPIQRLVGSGVGTVYVDGMAFDVRWSRPSQDAVTSWTMADTNEELVLPPGPVWWHVMPTGAQLVED